MVFSSMIFLWFFLPITLLIYNVIDKRYKNIFLLLASLLFYAWGEPKYCILMLLSIFINYTFGLLIYNEDSKNKRKFLLILSVIINLCILAYYKYFNFIANNFNLMFGKNIIPVREIILPVGISFYTFQALSYVVDIYRSKNNDGLLKAQSNINKLALYISLFPQLIAGPIVKYHDIQAQIDERQASIERVAYGIKRFILGLGKKVLIANTLAAVADDIFALQANDLTTSVAWLGILCYSLQIYFDFSGYSDMAIGLGEMFGFTFMENFNYPYISRSIKEFWRRWHISLSTWFKEYLYIPLGGNRKGKKRTYLNLICVFFMTGLWHGASWNFIAWGLFHGIFLVIERLWLGDLLKKNKFKALNHIYTILIVMIGWVFFRAEDMKYALIYIYKLFIPTKIESLYNAKMFINREIMIVLVLAILLSGVLQAIFPKFKELLYERNGIKILYALVLSIIFFACIVSVASSTYNPFIYFRF